MVISSQSSNQSFYQQSRSVFTEYCAMPGPVNSKPNDQSVDVAIIEFTDDGSFTNEDQLNKALGCITKARRENPNGALVVVFIHGWHHNAYWDDTHFTGFRKVLMSLALREAERYGTKGELGRRVIGVYFGWHGENSDSWQYRINANLTFWDRYKTAERIGKGEAIKQAIRDIVKNTKEPLTDPDGTSNDSPLIFVGHSMGALMFETAFRSLLHAEGNGLIEKAPASPTRCTRVESGNQPVPFPDLLLLLNSAADSQITKDIIKRLTEKRRKIITYGSDDYETPLLISATSKTDWVTKWAFRIGKFWRKTDGNDPALTSHQLKREPEGALCTPKHLMADFNQCWHCLRRPIIENQRLTSIAIDLPQEQDLRNHCHVRYRLEPKKILQQKGPFWLFKVPSGIIDGHNDIFNARSNLLMMALVQASGAIMSLAHDWKDTFEEEEGRCVLRRANA